MSLMPRRRVRSSSMVASNVISLNCVEPLLEKAQTTKKATWPPEASIQVNCSSMSFSSTEHTLVSHVPHASPCGRKLESQKVTIAKASKSMDWPAKPVKQKFSTLAC